ncbi:LytTR family transcriptional regulator [Lactiplantibacillus plantarum]|uniref:LytTR family DNA-binding domain-containing protein n=1 Tax=Lactiplantibacillus plantarum TaxID=1590 RepID=UPI000D31944C|nr:LytTR family DNA-binding domain-containing protein [Lactiplantibacillus plantarum]MBO2714579.1 LytTR family transcriptional regulator [Lactiplantibacillus plantarum]MCG0845395.1 hypothetical protein [Lactiplantibacillus plantarum]MCT4468342.1 LytTR family transcriptional regulator [Lactiplantibacillus plantarum]MCX3295540.1 LytTR family DNA-binding domain-containing protein [Lactiplantibacillus plantarum]PTS37088.1 LytTR family transcriptional regulator [Lactiplantibacillus plantarum]
MIKIRISKNDSDKDDLVFFKVKRITHSIKQAIDILKDTKEGFFASTVDSNREEKLEYENIVYVEYLNRQVFIYTSTKVYYNRSSLSQFKKQAPNYLAQISKSVLINLYTIKGFQTKLNGNLLVTLNTGEKQIVSRKFVAPLRRQLKLVSGAS